VKENTVWWSFLKRSKAHFYFIVLLRPDRKC